jgi:hypothetical protein
MLQQTREATRDKLPNCIQEQPIKTLPLLYHITIFTFKSLWSSDHPKTLVSCFHCTENKVETRQKK